MLLSPFHVSQNTALHIKYFSCCRLTDLWRITGAVNAYVH